MCGIAGIIARDGELPDLAVLENMAAAIAHRGPDGGGVAVDGGVGFAHRRLAIIDPVGGSQPMRSLDGGWLISFNGEIYNHRELRSELEAAGHRFTTRSDTEVVLAAFERWGGEAPCRLRGMFAIAVAHTASRRVWLVRDQLGIKPLLWMRGRGGIAFASEMAALRMVPWFDGALDLSAIDGFLRLQYVAAPGTVFRAVRKLPPGCMLEIDLASGDAIARRWWRPAWGRHEEREEQALDEHVAAVIDASVAAHMVSDVPYGVFLSGGVDSALVASSMARALGRPPLAFCIGFDDPEHDETGWAREAAALIGAELHIERVSGDAIALLPELLRHYGEPFADSSAIPTWHVSRLARGSVKMVLSGDGGDEFFAGYKSYAYWRRLHQGVGRPLAKRLLRPLLERLMPTRFPRPRADARGWFDQAACMDVETRADLWRPELRPSAEDPEVAADVAGLDPLELAQAVDVESYLPHDILAKVDAASMAHGLEVRTPLTDVRVLEAAASIPPARRQRISGGRVQGKAALVRIAERRLRPGFFDRPKQGFAVPLRRWLYDDGILRPELHHRLTDRHAPLSDLLRPAAVQGLCRSGSPDQIWSLLVLDTWLREVR